MLCRHFPAVFLIISSFHSVICVNTGLLNHTRSWAQSVIRKQRRAIDCDGFQCQTSNECIDDDKYCDGHVDCKDGSDETNRCKNLGCPGYLFRCKYGACISAKLECDGKIDCKDGSDENTVKCLNTSISNSKKCKETQFECKSGQCITADNKCDGTPDCNDKSDETLETCASLNCPGYTFKCKYGACVSRLGLCNGISDCFDNSDEDPDICDGSGTNITPKPPVSNKPPASNKPPTNNRPSTESTPGSCVLPQRINNGNWSIYGGSQFNNRPGEHVLAGTVISITCRRGFKVLQSSSLSVCLNGNWSPAIPECVQTCDPVLESTETTFVSCTKDASKVDCKDATSNTFAQFTCAPYYELPTNYEDLYCLDGKWDSTRPTCTPVCGEKNVKVKELIIGGQKVKRGSYPWTIAIYRNRGDFEHICGGTLINQRVIITAAHCVTNKKGEPLDTKLYRVAAGKYYRDYSDSRDTDAEFSEIEKIHVPLRYKAGGSQYEYDIAILITRETFNKTQFIQRVCIDWNQKTNYEQLIGTEGVVTGWGYTIRGNNASEVLKELSLPYIGFKQCYDSLDEEYQPYVKGDKICAGFWNQGVGVCEGDSGGGLSFLNTDERNRYYLRGIVSIAPQIDGSCDENQYSLFTKISNYIDFIKSYERMYRT